MAIRRCMVQAFKVALKLQSCWLHMASIPVTGIRRHPALWRCFFQKDIGARDESRKELQHSLKITVEFLFQNVNKMDPAPEQWSAKLAFVPLFDLKGLVNISLISETCWHVSMSFCSQLQDGFTPIHRACWGSEQRHADTVRVFLKAGVPYDEPSDEGHLGVVATLSWSSTRSYGKW